MCLTPCASQTDTLYYLNKDCFDDCNHMFSFFLVSFIQSVVLHKSTAKYRIKHLIWESSNTDCQNEHQQKRPKIVNDKSRNVEVTAKWSNHHGALPGWKKKRTTPQKNRTKINCKSFYYALWLGWDLDSYGVLVIAAFHPSIFGRKIKFSSWFV